MYRCLLLALAFLVSTSASAETTTCNKFGGQKRNAWWSYQTCNFLTKAAITPLIATQRAKTEIYSEYFAIYVTNNSIIIKDSNPGMHPPMVEKVTLVVDSGAPYQAEIFNYGFYPVVMSPIREAHILGDNYKKLISELKSGKELRVLWEQAAIPRSYNIIFSLEDAKQSIEHLEKNS